MNPYDAICIGESMVLLTPDPPARLGTAERLRMDVAGAESNVAAYLAMLGHRTAWVSRVGDDPLGRLVQTRVGRHGVDVDLVDVAPSAPTGVYFKDPDPMGSAVYYYRKGSAAASMDAGLWDALPGAHVVHLSGITPALSASCARLVRFGLAHRPVEGAVMSFDINYRPPLWPPTEAAPVLKDLANLADIVFVGLDEADRLWGCRNPDDVRAVLPSPRTVVIKDGAVGATSYAFTNATFVPAPSVTVVEPVGAGDAFAAGYLSGFLLGLAEMDRLALGHEIAVAALASVGDVAQIGRRRKETA
jgi:2-dehydro-3-deoxygluconokinase